MSQENGKKIIAFSIWGSIPMYTIGALKNIDLAKEIYPGWICRFYVKNDVPQDIIDSIIEKGGEVIIVDDSKIRGSFDGMFWRFMSASDIDVDVMISRDTDSRLSMREKLAVDDWLNSDKSFHIMRDHPYHDVPILGGMWGCRGGVLSNLSSMLSRWSSFDYKGCDQDFLQQVVYQNIVDDCVVHDEFFYFSPNAVPFPSERNNFEFVGEIFDENDKRSDHWLHLTVCRRAR